MTDDALTSSLNMDQQLNVHWNMWNNGAVVVETGVLGHYPPGFSILDRW